MSTTPNDQDYPSKIFDLQTLRSWVKHGVSDGPLKGFKVDPEQSFSPLSTKPIDWAMNTNDSISQDRLSKETRLVLEPFFDIKVFHPEHQDYSQTIRAHFDLGTAYAVTQCLEMRLTADMSRVPSSDIRAQPLRYSMR